MAWNFGDPAPPRSGGTFQWVSTTNNNNDNNINDDGFGFGNNNNNNNDNSWNFGNNQNRNVQAVMQNMNQRIQNPNIVRGLDHRTEIKEQEDNANNNNDNNNNAQCSVFPTNNNIASESDPLSLHRTQHIKTDHIIPACSTTIHWNISQRAIETARTNRSVIQLKKPVKISPSGRSFLLYFGTGIDVNIPNDGGFNWGGANNNPQQRNVYVSVCAETKIEPMQPLLGLGHMTTSSPFSVSIRIFDPSQRENSAIGDDSIQNAANWQSFLNLNNRVPQAYGTQNMVKRMDLFDLNELNRKIIDGVFRMKIKITVSPTIVTDVVLAPEVISPQKYLRFAQRRNGNLPNNHMGDVMNANVSNDNFSSSNAWLGLMRKMLNDQSFGDIEIVCNDGKRYRCHKDILSNFSPVFKAMLDHQMQESLENVIELKEENGLTMSHLLMYCYTGTISNDIKLDEVGTALLKASDKFGVSGLTMMLFDFVKTRIEPETVAMALILCKLYRGSECRAAVIKLNKFVISYLSNLKNMRAVLRSKSFELLFTEHPDLVKTVMLATNSINAKSTNEKQENDDEDKEVIYFDDEDDDDEDL